MEQKEITTWREETALERFQLISPLLDSSLDRDKKIQLRKDIALQNNLSVKTLRRYERSFLEKGFAGLKPADRPGCSRLPKDFEQLMQEAIVLKREVPTRSVRQIIYILETEGKAEPGVLKRSTVQDHLYAAGFGQKQMKKYNEGQKSSSKRFCKPNRMMLVQADIKYGPKLPIGPGRKRVQTYLSSIMDDHSRFVLSSEFYDNQEKEIVEDSFRKAILRYGRFEAAYVDNGGQYVSRQLLRSTAKLGIRVLHAKPFSGQSKGKIEKFHQVVDSFLAEARAKKIQTLEDLNRYWACFLEEYYQKKSHDGIREYYESQGRTVPEEGISPEMEWNRDARPLVFLDTSVVGEAFLHHEERVVNKGGCISFRGRDYEVSAALIGATVEIAYDPQNPNPLRVSYRDMPPIEAKPVAISPFCDKKPELPLSMQSTEPETSRFLDVLEKKHAESQVKLANAISFSRFRKEGR
jgi:transposase InsO family protein